MLDETRCQKFPEISGLMPRSFWKFPDFSSQKISGNFKIFLAFCFILTSKKIPEISGINFCNLSRKIPEISGNFQGYFARPLIKKHISTFLCVFDKFRFGDSTATAFTF